MGKILLNVIFCFLTLNVFAVFTEENIEIVLRENKEEINTELLNSLEEFLDSCSPKIGERTCMTLASYGSNVDEPHVKQRIVKVLLEKRVVKFGMGNAYMFRILRNRYSPEDFNDECKEILSDYCQSVTPNPNILLLFDTLGMTDFNDYISELVSAAYKGDSNPPSFRNEFAAMQIRARHGDKRAISRVINYIESYRPGDPYAPKRRFKFLEYMRQPEAIDVYYKYLMSDARFPFNEDSIDESRVPLDSPSRPLVAGSAIKYLAKLLVDFPLDSTDGTMYSLEEIETCRKWMTDRKGHWQIIGQIKNVNNDKAVSTH